MIDIVGMASGAAAAAVDDDASGSSPSGDSSDDDIENMRQAEGRITATARAATTATATVAAGDDGVGDGDEEDASLLAASLVEEAISSAISTHDAEVLAAGEADAGECAALALPIAPSDVKAVGAAPEVAATAAAGAVISMKEHAARVPDWVDSAKEGDQLDPVAWEDAAGVSLQLAVQIVSRDGSRAVLQTEIATIHGQEYRIMSNVLCHASAQVCTWVLHMPTTCAHTCTQPPLPLRRASNDFVSLSPG